MTNIRDTPCPLLGVGLPHLVYLTHESTLSDVCAIRSKELDQESEDHKWWDSCCCGGRFTKNMKLSHAKGISKRLSEVRTAFASLVISKDKRKIQKNFSFLIDIYFYCCILHNLRN